jgi:hypothetical protein
MVPRNSYLAFMSGRSTRDELHIAASRKLSLLSSDHPRRVFSCRGFQELPKASARARVVAAVRPLEILGPLLGPTCSQVAAKSSPTSCSILGDPFRGVPEGYLRQSQPVSAGFF